MEPVSTAALGGRAQHESISEALEPEGTVEII